MPKNKTKEYFNWSRDLLADRPGLQYTDHVTN